MFRNTAIAEGGDPVKTCLSPPPPSLSNTDRSKAVLLLCILYDTCFYVRAYMVTSDMAT